MNTHTMLIDKSVNKYLRKMTIKKPPEIEPNKTIIMSVKHTDYIYQYS